MGSPTAADTLSFAVVLLIVAERPGQAGLPGSELEGADAARAVMFGLLSVLAELQRELIAANTMDGLAGGVGRHSACPLSAAGQVRFNWTMVNLQVRSGFEGIVGRNAPLVIGARALRTFGYGCTSVLLAEMLTQDGDAPWQAGLLLAAAAAGSVAFSLLLGLFADVWGRRRVLVACGLLMAAAGAVFALSESFPVLVTAAFIGTISPSTNDNTPFSGVEQSILAQSCEQARHTRMFTVYNVTALLAGALGGLAAAGLGMQHLVSAGDAAFALYAVLAATTVVIFALLTPDAEAQPAPAAPAEPEPTSPIRSQPRRLPHKVRRLATLFAIDAFAGGLAVQAVLAWWFAHRYGASTTQLGLVFFAANLIPALAQLAAPFLAARKGLLAAMLVPHFTSNIVLACIPLAPTLGSAITLLLLRQALSKIDVPARQAFTAAIVPVRDRTAAASMTSLARSIAVSISPLAATALLTGPLAEAGAPLLLGAALAIGYDLILWRSYRTTPLTGT